MRINSGSLTEVGNNGSGKLHYHVPPLDDSQLVSLLHMPTQTLEMHIYYASAALTASQCCSLLHMQLSVLCLWKDVSLLCR